MAVEKRLREGLPLILTTRSGLWEDQDFVDKVTAMIEMESPQLPRILVNDFGVPIEPAPPGTGAGDDRSPSPPLGGASYGGPAHPIDPEEAQQAKMLRMKERELKSLEMDAKIAALRAGTAAPVPAAAATVEAAPVGNNGASSGDGGDKKVSASNIETKYDMD